MSYLDLFNQTKWSDIVKKIYSQTPAAVTRALHRNGKRDLNDFAALLSPAATPFLEEMASLSHTLTLKRFGKTIQLYIPLYLSNVCYSSCRYCGFKSENKIPRITLDREQIMAEVKVIKELGFDHLLLVTGDMGKKGTQYLCDVLQWVTPYFSQISMEVQTSSQNDYGLWIRNSLNSVMIYQETYNQQTYPDYHPKGPKSNFNYRLETPDRLGKAGIHKIGLGALLGLEDWRVDSWFTGQHLNYLERCYWRTKFSISFPRMRPAIGILKPKYNVSDRDLAQLICAYRIFNENVELSLSTREAETFRDHAIKFGITTISAGSKTDPGGYAMEQDNLEQFEISDNRTPPEIAGMLRTQGYEAIWKDWDIHYGTDQMFA